MLPETANIAKPELNITATFAKRYHSFTKDSLGRVQTTGTMGQDSWDEESTKPELNITATFAKRYHSFTKDSLGRVQTTGTMGQDSWDEESTGERPCFSDGSKRHPRL